MHWNGLCTRVTSSYTGNATQNTTTWPDDGLVWWTVHTSISSFTSELIVLQIILSCDDMEVVIPLVSRVKKYKICIFYFTLGNIPPSFRSQLSAIHLLGVAKSQHLRNGSAVKKIIVLLCINCKDIKAIRHAHEHKWQQLKSVWGQCCVHLIHLAPSDKVALRRVFHLPWKRAAHVVLAIPQRKLSFQLMISAIGK